MRMSQLFGQTLRDIPSDAQVISHQLLLRAGYIRPLGTGIFSYLHLAKRSMQKIEAILRKEMDCIGGQEITMPVVQPAENWKETQRWYQIGPEMARFKDRNGHDMVLAMTHEEAVADLVRHEVHSYKQLPRLIYHIQTKFRDEPRARAGLIRVREFTMKDSYSLDPDWAGLERQYRAHYQAYFNIFQRCGLDVIAVSSDPGMMGGHQAHEFMFLHPIGEDVLVLCDACGYTANRQVARFQRKPAAPETTKPMQQVQTPACKSIESLAEFLGIPRAKTAKAVFFIAAFPSEKQITEKFVFSVIRGDYELNETKLMNAIGANDLRPATEIEIKEIGAEPGYASPIGLPRRHAGLPVLVCVDDSISYSTNLVSGANQPDQHLLNTNLQRDYQADIITDIAVANEGYGCPECSSPLRLTRGVEVGNIFKLGTRYSKAMHCTFLDQEGKEKPIIMGSYGIGVGRLLACVAEQHHDEQGLIWPVSIAPYQVHLVLLRGKGAAQMDGIAEKLYTDLLSAGIDVLFDDRQESPGVKFADADLIGLPVRITVSGRAMEQGGVEIKLRSQSEKTIVNQEMIIPRIQSELKSLETRLYSNIREVPYHG